MCRLAGKRRWFRSPYGFRRVHPSSPQPGFQMPLRNPSHRRMQMQCQVLPSESTCPLPGPGMPDLRPITGIKTVPASPFYHKHPLTSSPDRRCRPLPPDVLSGFFLPDRRSAEALPVFQFPEPALRLCPFCPFRPEPDAHMAVPAQAPLPVWK